MMPPLDPIGPLDPLDPSRPAQEKWGGAKWTPDQERYWSPILADGGIDVAIAKLYELAVIWTNRSQRSDPGFDIRTETERTLRACLQAAMRHGTP